MNPEESMRTKRSASTSADAMGTSAKVASVAASVGGWALGMYAGFNLLVPLVATALVWLIGKKLFGKRRQAIVPAFCVQAGYLVWLVVVMMTTRAFLGPGLIDVVWLAIGLAWLWMKPGKIALCVLAIYQLLALPYSLVQFSDSDFGSAANKALLVHIVWHCLALFYLAWLYYRMSRSDQRQEATHS